MDRDDHREAYDHDDHPDASNDHPDASNDHPDAYNDFEAYVRESRLATTHGSAATGRPDHLQSRQLQE
jgi:hypothetical protein